MKKFLSLPLIAAAVAAMALSSAPARAQFYFAEPDLSSPPVTGAEPQLAMNLPGATPDELRAALVWHLRAALNVAALQCDFAPSLLTVSNYNASIAHHDDELAKSLATVTGYFHRTVGKGRTGDRAFDVYNTKTYSLYSTVHAQRDFCNEMSKVGREAIFAPRGSLHVVAQNRMGEIRKSLVPTGEQYFTNPAYGFTATLPDFGKKCWKKDNFQANCAKAWEQRASSGG